MAGCIERDAALKECDWYANEFCECEYAIMPLKGALENLPDADVRPVVRGQWIDETGFIFADLSQQVRCSKCGLIAYFYDKMPMNFCPNCGADMGEE